jgi:hypothetical protein
MKYILLFLISITSLFSQSVIITDVLTDIYPAIDVNFLVVDENGNAIGGNENDIELRENGISKAIELFNCNQDYINEPMSIVITLDNSLSMNDEFESKTISEITRESAKNILSLLHPDTEIAINYYNNQPYLLQDFTKDRSEVFDAIDSMEDPAFATDISKSFLDEDFGVIKLFENAQFDKKINLFMTDAPPSEQIDKDEIISSFNNLGITLYAISAKANLNNDLVEITKRTNGDYYNAAQTEKQLNNAFISILNYINGAEACTLTYSSELCDLSRDISLTYSDTLFDERSILINKDLLVEYSILNNNQINSGSQSNILFTSILSKKDDLIISNIESKFKELDLVSPQLSDLPITLNKGESLSVVLSNNTSGKNIYDFIEIESSSCFDDNIYLKNKYNSDLLEVITPNGGEEYYIKKSADLEWKDDSGLSEYTLDYSVDAGSNWKTIVSGYSDFDFPWLSIDGPATENALFRVSKKVRIESKIETIAAEEVVDPGDSGFEYIVPYQNDKYVAVINMNLDFEFSNVKFPVYALEEISGEDQGKNIKLLVMLDTELNVLEYKPILANSNGSKLAVIDDYTYLELDGFYNLKIDTLDFYSTDFNKNNGILIKFDENLEYINHKLFEFDNEFNNKDEYIIDLKSSNSRLHLLGKVGRFLNFDNQSLINEFYNSGLYFITSIDEDLNLIENDFFDISADSFDYNPMGIKPIDDENIIFWGEGEGTYFNLDSKLKGISVLFNTNNKNFSLKNFITNEIIGNLEIIDYSYYRGFEYWLYSSDSSLVTSNDEKIESNEFFNISLLSLSDEGEYRWSVGFDKFGLNKNLNLFNNESIVVAGRMNGNVIIDGSTISERGNTLFVSAVDLYTGNLDWFKYVGLTSYDGLLSSNGNNLITSGRLIDSTDFGNDIRIDQNFNNFFLWSMNSNSLNSFDISDSLWSIKSPGFEYIDTVDFGNVYAGSIKDTVVLDFFKITDNSASITIKNINIEDPGYILDINTPFQLEKDTDLKIILNVDIAGDGIAKGVITTNIGEFNFYVNSNEVGLMYRPFYDNDSLAIDFGEVLLGDEKSETLSIIANLGLANIGIDSVIIENDNGNNYSQDILSDKNIIFSNDTLISKFTYAPNFTGLHESRYLFYTDVNRNPFIINVTGVGISLDTIDITIDIDSTFSEPDKYIDLSTRITLNDNPILLKLDKLEIDIEFNATLMLPFRFDNEGVVQNKIRKLTLQIDNDEIQNGLSEDRFYTTIGNSISTNIIISSVRAYNLNGDLINEFQYSSSNGYFELTNICYTNGKYRLYSESEPTDLNLYSENGEYFVNYNLIEDGFTKISIYDTDGSLINHLINSKMNKGAYNTEIDTRNIANGSYIIQLETENIVISKMLIIVK